MYTTIRYTGLRFNESEMLEMYTTTMEFIYSMKWNACDIEQSLNCGKHRQIAIQ